MIDWRSSGGSGLERRVSYLLHDEDGRKAVQLAAAKLLGDAQDGGKTVEFSFPVPGIGESVYRTIQIRPDGSVRITDTPQATGLNQSETAFACPPGRRTVWVMAGTWDNNPPRHLPGEVHAWKEYMAMDHLDGLRREGKEPSGPMAFPDGSQIMLSPWGWATRRSSED